MKPSVSVVIPTYQRPGLVPRAVRSALAQTLDEIEVIVVMDGPDPQTRAALMQIDDPRCHWVELPEHVGHAQARNVGIAQARAPWVALLDDDDEWLPEKLARQMELAQASRWNLPVISCRVLARHDLGDLIWPRRLPRAGEALAEYLLCQSGLRGGEGLILPTTIFTKTELMRRVAFTNGLKRHADFDWLLRAAQVDGFGIEFVDAPLAIWHTEHLQARISHSTDWRFTLAWAQSHRAYLTDHAYASLAMTWASASAARARDWNAFFFLIAEAYRNGKPGIFDWLAHLSIWLVPFEWRRGASVWLTRWHQ